MILAETSNFTNWIPTIGALIISAITGFFSWWKTRPKHYAEQFQVFMDESSEFREEMRKDKENLKKEFELAHGERLLLRQKITEYETAIETCKKNLNKCIDDLAGAKLEIEKLKQKVKTLKEKELTLGWNDR